MATISSIVGASIISISLIVCDVSGDNHRKSDWDGTETENIFSNNLGNLQRGLGVGFYNSWYNDTQESKQGFFPFLYISKYISILENQIEYEWILF